MFGAPKYTLIYKNIPDHVKAENADAFCGELVGEGPYNHVVVLFDKKFLGGVNNSGDLDIKVAFSIVALPENLMVHHQDIVDGRGKIYKGLAKEINKITSVLVAEAVKELKEEEKKKADGKQEH